MEKLEETAKFCCEGEKRNGIVAFAEHIPCVLIQSSLGTCRDWFRDPPLGIPKSSGAQVLYIKLQSTV